MGQQVSESRRVFLSTATAEIVHGKRRSFLRAGNVKSELPSLRVDMGSNIFHTFYNGHPTTDITNWITFFKPTLETHSFQTLSTERMGKTMQKPPPGSRACEKHVLLRMILEGNKVFPQHSWSKNQKEPRFLGWQKIQFYWEFCDWIFRRVLTSCWACENAAFFVESRKILLWKFSTVW